MRKTDGCFAFHFGVSDSDGEVVDIPAAAIYLSTDLVMVIEKPYFKWNRIAFPLLRRTTIAQGNKLSRYSGGGARTRPLHLSAGTSFISLLQYPFRRRSLSEGKKKIRQMEGRAKCVWSEQSGTSTEEGRRGESYRWNKNRERRV